MEVLLILCDRPPARLAKRQQALGAVPPHTRQQARHAGLRPVAVQAEEELVHGRAVGIIDGVGRVVEGEVGADHQVIVSPRHKHLARLGPHVFPDQRNRESRLVTQPIHEPRGKLHVEMLHHDQRRSQILRQAAQDDGHGVGASR